MYSTVALFFGECCMVEIMFEVVSRSLFNVVCKGWLEVTAGE